MTPHEVIKNSIEKFEEIYVHTQLNIEGGIAYKEWRYEQDAEEALEEIKSSQLFLLLSVKEIVCNIQVLHDNSDYELAQLRFKTEVLSLLDTEINKIKEL